MTAIEGRTEAVPIDDGAMLRQMLASTPDVVFFKDRAGRYVAFSDSVATVLGTTPEQVAGRSDHEILTDAETARLHAETDRAVLDTGAAYRAAGRPLRVDGCERSYDVVKSAMRDADGEIVGLMGIARDITPIRAAEATARHQNDYLSAFNTVVLGLLEHPDREPDFAELLAAAGSMIGADTCSLYTTTGSEPELACQAGSSEWDPTLLRSMAHLAWRSGAPAHLTFDPADEPNTRVHGAVDSASRCVVACFPVDVHGPGSGALVVTRPAGADPFRPDDLDAAAGVANQVTLALFHQRTTAETRRRADHDALTGLPNRYRFEALLRDELDGPRSAHGVTGVVFLDLDGFKEVNDTQGHRAGDGLLRQVADRLRSRVRSGSTVARLGGDEFAVIVRDVPDLTALRRIGRRLADACAEPFPGGHAPIGASVGVACAPDHGTSPAQLLAEADVEMYRDKRSRRCRRTA